MIGDLVGKAVNALVQLGRDRIDRELLEGLHQRMGEAVQAVSVLDDGVALHVVQHQANLLGRVFAMVEERDELRDRALEINVVLPERVIGVDEQSLGPIFSPHRFMITARTRIVSLIDLFHMIKRSMRDVFRTSLLFRTRGQFWLSSAHTSVGVVASEQDAHDDGIGGARAELRRI